MKTISIGSDHAAYELKQKIKLYLKSKDFVVVDQGCYSTESCDYADFAHKVSKDVLNNRCDFGILMCGSGNGINMSANKWDGIRSALCWNPEIAKMARQHNDANILTLPARYISEEDAISCVESFLTENFEGGRHTNRIAKISTKKDSKDNFFYIPKTSRTPHVTLNKEINKLTLFGRSLPENPLQFYNQIEEQIDLINSDSFSIEIDLEYFNSSSSKCLFNLLTKLDSKFNQLTVLWICEEDDLDMVEHIKDFSDRVNIKIILKENV